MTDNFIIRSHNEVINRPQDYMALGSLHRFRHEILMQTTHHTCQQPLLMFGKLTIRDVLWLIMTTCTIFLHAVFFFFFQNDVLLQFEGLKYYEIYACTMKTPDKES